MKKINSRFSRTVFPAILVFFVPHAFSQTYGTGAGAATVISAPTALPLSVPSFAGLPEAGLSRELIDVVEKMGLGVVLRVNPAISGASALPLVRKAIGKKVPSRSGAREKPALIRTLRKLSAVSRDVKPKERPLVASRRLGVWFDKLSANRRGSLGLSVNAEGNSLPLAESPAELASAGSVQVSRARATLGKVWGALSRLSPSKRSAPVPADKEKLAKLELTAEQVRWRPNVADFGFKDTGTTTDHKLTKTAALIGQDSALEALQFGLGVKAKGYNVFVQGAKGSGRTMAVMRLLKKIRKGRKPPPDLVTVTDLDDEGSPRILHLSAGKGKEFRKGMETLYKGLKKSISEFVKGEPFTGIEDAVKAEFEAVMSEKMEVYMKKLSDTHIGKFGTVLVESGDGNAMVALTFDGEPLRSNNIDKAIKEGKFTKEEWEAAAKQFGKNEGPVLAKEYTDIQEEGQELAMEAMKKVESSQKEAIGRVIKPAVASVSAAFRGEKALSSYLEKLTQRTIDKYQEFLKDEGSEKGGRSMSLGGGLGMLLGGSPEKSNTLKDAYEIDVLVSNDPKAGAPVVYEKLPTFENLFGKIEGGRIRPGAILKANGGFLVLRAWDVVREPAVWPALMKVPKNGEVEITDRIPTELVLNAGKSQKEKVKVSVKIILIGDGQLYHIAREVDPDFADNFKALAQFDSSIDRTPENMAEYLAVIVRLVKQGSSRVKKMNNEAVGAIMEFSARLAGSSDKLSTLFRSVEELIIEAGFWAKEARAKTVGREHVIKALQARTQRHNLRARKMLEMTKKDMLMIDVEGSKVGQVNGLYYFEVDGMEFGRPARITATSSLGEPGIIMVDRKAKMTGNNFDKAAYIIESLLRDRFTQKVPFSAHVRVSFEQTYGGIDGDSASVAEFLSIISSLSGLPLRQDLAVTGSLNQKGDVQPIGGENQKIEGFFDVCKAKGLTGTQGVVVPRRVANRLMLRDDIVKAVGKGEFHIYAVDNVDEAVELFTGIKAGDLKKDGTYPKNTVNRMVTRRMEEMYKSLHSLQARK